MKKILTVLILFGLISIWGCASENATGEAVKEVPKLLPKGMTEISLNEEVVNDNISLEVLSWGFTPKCGYKNPQEGAKFLWIYVTSKNVGDIPLPLTTKFMIQYRGVNVTPVYSGTWNFYNFKKTTYKYFPETGQEGLLLFEVPNGLGDNDAEFIADMNGKKLILKLDNPVPDEPFPIIDELIGDCKKTVSGDIYYCQFWITLKNKRSCDCNEYLIGE
ncbi:MAG: hypothetical protein ABIA37_04670, partial [Candidatus Woesearchaeota archaeon]